MSARRSFATVALAGLSSIGLLLTAGCTSGPLARPSKQQQASSSELRERVLELQRQVTVNEIELARLRGGRAAREAGGAPPRRSSATTRPRTNPAGADRTAQPESFRRTSPSTSPAPTTSRPAPSTTANRDGGIEADDLEILPEESEPVRGGTGGGEVRTPLPPVGTSRPAADPTRSGGAQAVYDEGFALYHQGRYVDAETTFRRYLQDHSGTDLDDNARFWIGASRYAREDYQGALAAFRETIEKHPKGNKAADALLQVGRCLERLGDREGAREAYGEVVSRFPNSAAAAVAEEYRSALP